MVKLWEVRRSCNWVWTLFFVTGIVLKWKTKTNSVLNWLNLRFGDVVRSVWQENDAVVVGEIPLITSDHTTNAITYPDWNYSLHLKTREELKSWTLQKRYAPGPCGSQCCSPLLWRKWRHLFEGWTLLQYNQFRSHCWTLQAGSVKWLGHCEGQRFACIC